MRASIEPRSRCFVAPVERHDVRRRDSHSLLLPGAFDATLFGRLTMDATSVSLLQQLRGAPHDDAWERFVCQYRPLLLYWARRLGLQDQDAADLVQEVFIVM